LNAQIGDSDEMRQCGKAHPNLAEKVRMFILRRGARVVFARFWGSAAAMTPPASKALKGLWPWPDLATRGPSALMPV